MNVQLRHLCFALLICFSQFAFGQLMSEDTSQNQAFFSTKKFDSKCNVGIEMTASQILKKQAAMKLGLNLNWVINHKYVVSARYHVLTSPVNVQRYVRPGFTDETYNIVHHFAGLGFSYILFHNKKFSFQPELTAGWGVVKYEYLTTKPRTDFAVIMPAVYGVWNAHRYFRMGVGVNYMATAGANLNGLKNADFSGVGGVIFFRVGTF